MERRLGTSALLLCSNLCADVDCTSDPCHWPGQNAGDSYRSGSTGGGDKTLYGGRDERGYRVLVDGNRVVYKSLVGFAGMAKGECAARSIESMRRERWKTRRTIICIDDPVAGVFCSLSPQTHTARKGPREHAIELFITPHLQPTAAGGLERG